VIVQLSERVDAIERKLEAFKRSDDRCERLTLPLDNTEDADQANSWTSFTLAIEYSLGALGPLSIGMVRDLTNSFVPALWLLAAVGVLMLAIAPFLKPARIQQS